MRPSLKFLLVHGAPLAREALLGHQVSEKGRQLVQGLVVGRIGHKHLREGVERASGLPTGCCYLKSGISQAGQNNDHHAPVPA